MSSVKEPARFAGRRVCAPFGIEVIPVATANIGGIYLATGSSVVAGLATLVILTVVFRLRGSSGG